MTVHPYFTARATLTEGAGDLTGDPGAEVLPR